MARRTRRPRYTSGVRIRYHAGARDLAGCSVEELPGGAADLAALVERLRSLHPRLAPHLDRMRFAVAGEFAVATTAVQEDDEVDVMPPVAGGAPESSAHEAVVLAEIRSTPLSLDECHQAVLHPGAGAVVVFTGVVRDHAPDAEGVVRDVVRLDYEAHDTLAPKEMRRVLETVAAECPGVRLAATHRIGELQVGDLAVVVAASAAHRGEAFEAGRRAIDRIKETVPIWKHEHGKKGDPVWVALEEP